MDRLALVTGAEGFVGRRLCSALRDDGWRVRAVDRAVGTGPWDESRTADLTDPGSLPELCRDVDTVFHLAAKTHAVAASADDADSYRRLNVDMTRDLVQECVRQRVAGFIFMSSVKVYGEGGEEAIAETAPPAPASLYGRTKLEAEQIVQEAGRQHGLAVGVLRSPLMYGPGVKGNLAEMLSMVKRGLFPPLPETGNRRSLVDVRDVARALALLGGGNAPRGATYVVTDGQVYSSRRILDLMRAALGRPALQWAPPLAAYRAAAAAGTLVRRLGVPFPMDRVRYEKLFASAEYTTGGLARDLGFAPVWSLDRALPDMIR